MPDEGNKKKTVVRRICHATLNAANLLSPGTLTQLK
jgi:hypothetical protein